MTDFGGKTSIFSHPVYIFLRKFSLQDFRGGSNHYCLHIFRFPQLTMPYKQYIAKNVHNVKSHQKRYSTPNIADALRYPCSPS
ncbi:hypothetical protein EC491_25110 [Salmonella enterica subsp. enterica]|nr:hypothetical protein AM468_00450 [Escherichia coli]EAB6278482.1 hypothetical protein [Salmonella enterica subsp. enterica serovar Typhimurium]EFA5375368.1 hypothetical protein [Escherichia coli O53]EFK43190.1 hypothetical protein HMPREF9346_05260 [Escherichia coli MS 119-7]EFO2210258.1 hypothetical protein [Escherichia coli O2]